MRLYRAFQHAKPRVEDLGHDGRNQRRGAKAVAKFERVNHGPIVRFPAEFPAASSFPPEPALGPVRYVLHQGAGVHFPLGLPHFKFRMPHQKLVRRRRG